MSNFPIVALARAAALAGMLVVPAVSAFAGEPYYANVTNPHPELSGQKIRPSEIEVVANILDPHPELREFPAISVARTTPSK